MHKIYFLYIQLLYSTSTHKLQNIIDLAIIKRSLWVDQAKGCGRKFDWNIKVQAWIVLAKEQPPQVAIRNLKNLSKNESLN
jgi:hypothetical protein